MTPIGGSNKKKKFSMLSPDEFEFDGEPTIADEEY